MKVYNNAPIYYYEGYNRREKVELRNVYKDKKGFYVNYKNKKVRVVRNPKTNFTSFLFITK